MSINSSRDEAKRNRGAGTFSRKPRWSTSALPDALRFSGLGLLLVGISLSTCASGQSLSNAEAQGQATGDAEYDAAENRRAWESELAFNPYFYFRARTGAWEKNYVWRRSAMVAAEYEHSLRGSLSWTFAIDDVCTDGADFVVNDCKPIFRMVSFRSLAEYQAAGIPDHARECKPKNMNEMAVCLQEWMNWQEVDMRTCRNAMGHLEKLNDARGPLWSRRMWLFLVGQIKKPLPFEPVVSTDGDEVSLIATSRYAPDEENGSPEDSQTRQWSGRNGNGFASDWTREMIRIAKPCLKPSSAPAPWTNVLEAHAQWDKKE